MVQSISPEERAELVRLAPVARAMAQGMPEGRVVAQLVAAGWKETDARGAVRKVRDEYFERTKRVNRSRGFWKICIGSGLVALAVSAGVAVLILSHGAFMFFAGGAFVWGVVNIVWGMALLLDP
jgi:hypothetical protein